MRNNKALKLENTEICKICGGQCCKGGGCNYLSQDFEELKIEYIESLLDSGHISIAAAFEFAYTQNGVLCLNTTLHLRERDIDHDAIDLISVRSQCISLDKDHCSHTINKRPSMGAALNPSYPLECLPSIEHDEFLASWEPYQKILGRIVRRRTGKSVDAKISEDVENLFYKLYSKQINEYDSKGSIIYLSGMLKDFKKVFPEETKRGIDRSLENVPMGLLRNYRK